MYKTIKTLNVQNKKNKQKKRILKAAMEKDQVTYKGKPIRITSDISTKIMNAS